MGTIQESLRGSLNLYGHYRSLLEGEGDQTLEQWIGVLDHLRPSQSPSAYDTLIWVVWERHGLAPLKGEMPFLLRSCQAIPFQVWVQTHEAFFALAQTWPDKNEREQLQYAMTEAALARLHTSAASREAVDASLLARILPHLEQVIENLLSYIAGERESTGLVAVQENRLSPSCLLAWREELGEPALRHADRRALLTWEREVLSRRSILSVERPELIVLFESFSKAERVEMMRDGAGPPWLLSSTPDREVLRNFFVRYIHQHESWRCKNLLDNFPELEWADAIIYSLAELTFPQLVGLEKILEDLAEFPLETLLETLERCSPEIALCLHSWLCQQLEPEEILRLWPKVGFGTQQVFARILLWHAVRLEDDTLLTHVEGLAHSPQQKQLLVATRAAYAPDWDALIALPKPWAPQGEPVFEAEALRALGLAWETSKKSYKDRNFLAHQASGSPLLMMALVRAMATDEQVSWGMAGILTATQEAWYKGALETVLLTEKLKAAKELYDKAMQDGLTLTSAVHLRVLQEGTVTMQRHATRALSEQGGAHLEDLCDLLRSRKGGVRSAVAQTLELIGDSKAQAALRQALEKEKSAKVKPLLQAALEACDPKMVRLKEQMRGGMGIYRLEEPLEPREGLEALRAILYEPPTPISWARLCDVIARMQTVGMAEAALDYLSDEALERWPLAQRVLPWGWDKEPGLARLGQKGEGDWTWWLPVSMLTTPARGELFEAALPVLEHRARKRKLPVEQVDLWLRWIERAWFWCQENDMSLEVLEAQLDGGSYHGMSRPPTSCLKLVHGFAVCLTREPCYTGETAEGGIRWVRVPLGKGHILRSKFKVDSYSPHLHLNLVLPLD